MALRPILLESLPKLANLYRKDWPKHILSNNSIKIIHEWLVKDPNLDCVKVFALGDDWKQTGTFMWKFFNNIYFDTLETSHDSLKALLKKSEWTNKYVVNSVRSDLVPTFLSSMQELKISTDAVRHANLFIFKMDVEDQMEFPKGLYCAKLDENHAKKIDDLWPTKQHFTDSLSDKKMLIKLNPSSGLFNEKGELIGWNLLDIFGLSHSVHILEEYRGKGYLSLVVWHLSKQTLEKGFEVASMVGKTGILLNVSRKLGTEYDSYKCFKLLCTNAKL